MFVAVAAAGMLASCSSDSLTAGSDPTIEPGQKDLVPIEIGVATPMARSGMTRGTGTVGAVEDGSGNAVNNDGTVTGTPKANIWAGQKVNVYMFDQGTLDLAQFDGAAIFDNAVMDTPPATETTNSGLAHYVDPSSGRYLVKYYPLSRAYDFWGYRIDDAKNADGTAPATAPVKNGEGNKYQVKIKVDGSQDVLGAKTKDPDLDGTGLTSADLYSAKAARKGIQPKLDFNHLMTRLTFEAYPGNDNAKTVYVTGIRVRAINDTLTTEYQTPVGTLDIAGTGDGFEQKINWVTSPKTDAPDPFILMKRQEAVLGQDSYSGIAANSWYALTADLTDNNQFITKAAHDAINEIKGDYTLLAAASWYSSNAAPTDNTQFIDAAAYAMLPTGTPGQADYTAIAADSWYSLNIAPTNNTRFIDATAYAALPDHAQGEYTLLAADSWYEKSTALGDNTQFISATAYGNLPATSTAADTEGNMNLVALTDGTTTWATNGAVSMTFGTGKTDGSEKAPIGESIIAPDAEAYEIEIDLAQKVAKYEDSDVADPDDWTPKTFNSIKTVVRARPSASNPAPRFEIGKSYDFIFKVYGLEKIQVSTVLEPWIFGENINVVTE